MSRRVVNLILSLVLPVLLATTLAGCWDRREVNDTAFVLAMGIARDADGGFRVVTEIVQPKMLKGASDSSGGGGGKAGPTSAMIRETRGQTVYSALSRLSVTLGRNIDDGHCNTLIVSEEILKDGGLAEILDWLTRFYEIRREKIVLATDDDPLAVIAASPQLEPTQGLNLYKTLTTAKGDCLPSFQSTIRDIMVRQSTSGVHVILGRVELAQDASGDNLAVFSGIDVLDGDRLIGTIPKDESRFVNMILNESRGSTIVLELPTPSLIDLLAKPTPGYHGGDSAGSEEAPPKLAPVAVQVTSTRTTVRARLENGAPVIEVSLKVSGQLPELGTPIDLGSPEAVKRLQDIMSQYVADRVRATIALTQSFPKGGDVFFFCEAIHDRYPAVWKQIHDRWDDYYKTLKVNVSVDSLIYGSGRALDPSVPHR